MVYIWVCSSTCYFRSEAGVNYFYNNFVRCEILLITFSPISTISTMSKTIPKISPYEFLVMQSQSTTENIVKQIPFMKWH